MFDRYLRPLIDPPLNRMGRHLARAGIGADAVTLLGLLCGLAAGLAVALDAPLAALARMMEPVAGDGFTVREVSQKVNAVRNEGPSLLEPLPPQPSQGELF